MGTTFIADRSKRQTIGDIDRLAQLAMRVTAEVCVRKALDAYERNDDEDLEFALFAYDLDSHAILRADIRGTAY